MEELWNLKKLGINNIHMYADLFTVNREQVVELCKLMIEEKIKMNWMCNSRVDYVDEEMLQLMGKAGCWFISWGIESGNEQILNHARKGISLEKVDQALTLVKESRDHELGLFHHRLAGRDRRQHPRDDRFCQSSCRWISPCSTSPRLIRARRSSLRWSRKAGSGPGHAGSRWTWIRKPSWIIPTCRPNA